MAIDIKYLFMCIFTTHAFSLVKYLFLCPRCFFFLAVLGLCCCLGFSPVMASGVHCLVVVCKLVIVVASVVVEHRLWSVWASVVSARGLSSYGVLA